MEKNTGYPRWIDPNGEIHLFMNCKNIDLDETGTLLVESFGANPTRSVSHEFEINDDVPEGEAEDTVTRWKEYLTTLVSAKPFPNTKDAQTAGCKCKIDFAHDPYCSIVVGNSSIRATPDPLGTSAPTEPTVNRDQLNDILADLAHRLMEQNVSVDALVEALKPPEQQDPYYVPIPGFKNLADREPTPTERQCFLAGVMQFAVNLVNRNIEPTLQAFFDRLSIPTVKCGSCSRHVPLERSWLTDNGRYGLDCCHEKDDG